MCMNIFALRDRRVVYNLPILCEPLECSVKFTHFWLKDTSCPPVRAVVSNPWDELFSGLLLTCFCAFSIGDAVVRDTKSPQQLPQYGRAFDRDPHAQRLHVWDDRRLHWPGARTHRLLQHLSGVKAWRLSKAWQSSARLTVPTELDSFESRTVVLPGLWGSEVEADWDVRGLSDDPKVIQNPAGTGCR